MTVSDDRKRLQNAEFVEELLYTAFLLLRGVGYVMALNYLYLGHQGHDGKQGLLVLDIAETYYGNRNGIQLEAAISIARNATTSWPGSSPGRRTKPLSHACYPF
ncbi:MAG: hypothetical protein IT488_12205 [Gammaproteobacteria bacterium]|nr:hypothetical protein [Gammaproteobacteria bacterium]